MAGLLLKCAMMQCRSSTQRDSQQMWIKDWTPDKRTAFTTSNIIVQFVQGVIWPCEKRHANQSLALYSSIEIIMKWQERVDKAVAYASTNKANLENLPKKILSATLRLHVLLYRIPVQNAKPHKACTTFSGSTKRHSQMILQNHIHCWKVNLSLQLSEEQPILGHLSSSGRRGYEKMLRKSVQDARAHILWTRVCCYHKSKLQFSNCEITDISLWCKIVHLLTDSMVMKCNRWYLTFIKEEIQHMDSWQSCLHFWG